MNRVLLALLSLLASSACAQAPLNRGLKRELDSMEVEDQKYRVIIMHEMLTKTTRLSDSVAQAANIPRVEVPQYITRRMLETDSADIKRVGQIIRRVGYPGKTLVGSPTNQAALDVIQHSNRIAQYLPLVEKAAQQGEVPFYLYARMLDRQLMYEGKEQLYGTQARSYGVLNARTGQRETVRFIWPIKDAARVNQRRKKAGFDTTVEANAKRLGVDYKPMSLEEARRIETAAKAAP